MKRLDSKFGDLIRDGLIPPGSILASPYPKNHPVQAHAPRQASMRASPIATGRTSSQHPSTHPTPAAIPAHLTPAATPTALSAPASALTPRDAHDHKRRRLTAPPNPGSTASSNLASHPPTPGIRPETIGQTRRSSTPNMQALKKRRNPPKREVLSEDEDDEDEDELDEEGGEDKRLYCTCQQVSYGNMVACDDGDCPFEWFHWGKFISHFIFISETGIDGECAACVNLTKEPPGKWYCPTCTQRREKFKNVRG